MQKIDQGSILKVDRIAFPVIVVSNHEFNRSGNVLACPVMKQAAPGPLHIPLRESAMEGIVMCEQVRYLDLSARHFSVMGEAAYYDIMDISDAVVSMVEYLGQ